MTSKHVCAFAGLVLADHLAMKTSKELLIVFIHLLYVLPVVDGVCRPMRAPPPPHDGILHNNL